MTDSLNLLPGSILKETVTSTPHGEEQHDLESGSSVFWYLVTETNSKGMSKLFPGFAHAVLSELSYDESFPGTIIALESTTPDDMQTPHNSTLHIASTIASNCDVHDLTEADYQYEVVSPDSKEIAGLFFRATPGLVVPVLSVISKFTSKAV